MRVQLLAFDFGSTTMKALEASASLTRSAVTGRSEIGAVTTLWRSEPEFTPFNAEQIDQNRLEAIVDRWLNRSGRAKQDSLLTGGVIITGLAAQKSNAQVIANTIRQRMGEAVVALADDPLRESWLAFMGSCAGLSSAHPDIPFVNIDIGGGTANLACGMAGRVSSTSCLWVGARHFQFQPGSYQLVAISPQGNRQLAHLKIKIKPGEEMSREQISKIVGFYVAGLEKSVELNRKATHRQVLDHQKSARLVVPSQPSVTFSGGVGEILYRMAHGESFARTPFGDLGVDLAKALLQSKFLGGDVHQMVPANLGRATVSGLAFHGVEVSGATVHAPDPRLFPMRDLPLLGRIHENLSDSELWDLLLRARGSSEGGGIFVHLARTDRSSVAEMGKRLCQTLRKIHFPKTIPLVLFLSQNAGKVLGSYVCDWGRLKLNLVVIDEIQDNSAAQGAYYASVFRTQEQNVLVSFYGGLNSYG
jgi:ethanolamine utilization protein EutA